MEGSVVEWSVVEWSERQKTGVSPLLLVLETLAGDVIDAASFHKLKNKQMIN